MAGEARTHGACVTSVLCTRVLVCKAQSSERRRGSGEAKPGARHPLCALFFALEQKREACIYRTQRLNPIGSQPRCARGSCCLGRRQDILAATAAPLATLHSVALMDMGRKPYTEAAKERRRIRRMEALLPPHVLHGDDDCNQLVAPFNTESETSHTARGSSDSRTGYDGGPLDRAISGPAWTPSSSYLQPTWAPQPERKKGAKAFSVRSWRSRSQHHLKHLPWLHLLHATMQHL